MQTPAPTPYNKAARPVHINYPAIQLYAEIGPVGYDGTDMDVIDSNEEVSWFQFGASPGEQGNILLAAHRVWKKANGPFWNLQASKVGDHVILTDENGHEWLYVVDEVLRIEYLNPPERIMDLRGEERVTMITCVGTYSNTLGTSEERHIVILKPEEQRSYLPEQLNEPAPSNTGQET